MSDLVAWAIVLIGIICFCVLLGHMLSGYADYRRYKQEKKPTLSVIEKHQLYHLDFARNKFRQLWEVIPIGKRGKG